MAKKIKKNNTNNHNDDYLSNNDMENYSSDLMEDKREEEYASLWCPICRDTTIFIDDVCTSCGFKKNKNKLTNHNEVDEERNESTQNTAENNLYNDDDLDLDLHNSYDDNDDF